MRCLYCGKELALFKRLTGGAEFCSDAHRQQYQEEYNQLALSRLLQASPLSDGPPKPADAGFKEGAGLKAPAASGGLGVLVEADLPSETPTAAWPIPGNGSPAPAEDVHHNGNGHGPVAQKETEPPQMAGFLAASPTPAIQAPAKAPAGSAEPALPEVPAFPATGISLALAPTPSLASAIDMASTESPQDPVSPKQEDRSMELRDSVPTVPDLSAGLPATDVSGLRPLDRVMEVHFAPNAPSEASSLWMEETAVYPELSPELGDLARLAFATAGWDEIARQEGLEVTELPSQAPEPASAAMETPIESRAEAVEELAAPEQPPAPVEEAPVEEASGETVTAEAAPEPVAEFSLPEPPQAPPIPVRPLNTAPLASRIETLRSEGQGGPMPLELAPVVPDHVPSVELETRAETEPIPGVVTKPLPLTLHGHAPGRGKPIHIFPSALARAAGVQVPKPVSLPLRPTIVFGSTPAPEAPPAEPKPVVVPVPVAKIEVPKVDRLKMEPRMPGSKTPSVRPAFRTLPKPSDPARQAVMLKAPVPKAKAEPVAPAKKAEEPKPVSAAAEAPEQIVPEQIKIPEAAAAPAEPEKETKPGLKEAKAQPVAENPVVEKPEPAMPEAEKPAPVQEKPAEKPPEKAERPKEAPQPIPYPDLPELDLHLPGMPAESPGFWSRLPLFAKVCMAAALLVAAAVGILYFNNKNSAQEPKGPVVVAAGTVLASGDAGWLTDWAPDPPASKRQRHIDVMRASQSLSDYRLEIEGQIERKAMGWVFRASNPKNFYVSKIEIVKPGLEPTIQITRFAVIDGVEQPRQAVPLTLKVRPDTLYKVRFEAMGDHFTTWILDQKVDEWTDARIKSGGVGLYREADESLSMKGGVNVIPLVIQK